MEPIIHALYTLENLVCAIENGEPDEISDALRIAKNDLEKFEPLREAYNQEQYVLEEYHNGNG